MLRAVLFFLIAGTVALGGGAASVIYVLAAETGLGDVSAGGWTAYPELGTQTSNPYARARIALRGLLVLGQREGLVYSADRDSNGDKLRRDCRYALEGRAPSARFWTLHADAASDHPGDQSLNSYQVVFLPDNSMSVSIGARPAPGNWLPLTGTGPMTLKLTLYDAPAANPQGGAAEALLPQILKTGCDA